MSERSPTLAEVIRTAIETFSDRLPVALPAKVVKYEQSLQRVSCKVLVQHPYFDESDARQVESIAVIPGVPVLFPGSAGFRMVFPISDGNLQIEGSTVPATTGLLIWCDRSLDRWLSGNGQEVDPEIDHLHDQSDAVFIPGLNPFGQKFGKRPSDAASIGSDTDSSARITFKKDGIELGEGASKGVARDGDHADVGTLVLTIAGTSVLGGTYTDPDGSPTTITSGATITLKAKINESSSKISAID